MNWNKSNSNSSIDERKKEHNAEKDEQKLSQNENQMKQQNDRGKNNSVEPFERNFLALNARNHE